MQIKLSNSIDNIPLTKKLWNELVQKNSTNTVFQTYEWFISWWGNFNENHEMFFLTAYKDDNIVGFAPLMISIEPFGRRIIKFIGDGNSDYCDFVINENRYETISAFLDYINKSEIKWSSISLLNIPSSSTTRACVDTYCLESNIHIQVLKNTKTPILLLNDTQLVHEMTNKYSVMRHVKKINKAGSVTIKNTSDSETIEQYLNIFFNQHIQRYSLKKDISLFSDNKNKSFYKDLTNNLKETNWILFTILFFDNKPIAFHFGFAYNNSFTWYKPSFDINYKQLSPGTVLLKSIIEYSSDKLMKEFDFTIGDESFKSRFSNLNKKNNNLVLYKSPILYRLSQIRCLMSKLLSRIK